MIRELKKRMLGMRGPDWSSLVIEEFNLQDKIESVSLVAGWESNLNNLCNQVQKMPGADELTRKLSEMKVTMAIATSSRKDAVAVKRKNHEEMFNRMSLIVCGDDDEVNSLCYEIFVIQSLIYLISLFDEGETRKASS